MSDHKPLIIKITDDLETTPVSVLEEPIIVFEPHDVYSREGQPIAQVAIQQIEGKPYMIVVKSCGCCQFIIRAEVAFGAMTPLFKRVEAAVFLEKMITRLFDAITPKDTKD